MKVFVTGASGFVGHALSLHLHGLGWQVSATARTVPSDFPDDIAFYPLDLVSTSLSDGALQAVDCVVHLAGMADQGASESLEAYRQVNVTPAVALARQAIKAGVSRFVFVSSMAVHGASPQAAITESSPLDPATAYAASKLEAEQQLMALFADVKGADLVIVRPPLVYGAAARGNFRKLLALANSRLPLPFGRCRNQRSMVSVDTLVCFLATCCSTPAAAGQTFLIADEPALSTAEVISSLRRGMGRSPGLLPVPPVLMRLALTMVGKRGMFTQLYGDCSVELRRAAELLRWAPVSDTRQQLEQAGKQYADALH